jgi:hypothetical protein
MATERFSAESIVRLFERRQVVTMDELKEALGTGVDMTVFRKLRTLDYLSSYSHGGRHYASERVPSLTGEGFGPAAECTSPGSVRCWRPWKPS